MSPGAFVADPFIEALISQIQSELLVERRNIKWKGVRGEGGGRGKEEATK